MIQALHHRHPQPMLDGECPDVREHMACHHQRPAQEQQPQRPPRQPPHRVHVRLHGKQFDRDAVDKPQGCNA